jgi:hypothetical protein
VNIRSRSRPVFEDKSELPDKGVVVAVADETRASIIAACLRLFRDRDGVVLVIVAVSLGAIIGLAGLATEAGLWYAIKRQDQSAADAAALAAAFEYGGAIETGVTTDPTAAATAAANANEFSTTAPNTITVQNPPSCDAAGKCSAQVTLTHQLNSILGRIALPSTVTIATTATGGYQSLVNSSGNPIGQTCLIGLGTYGSSPPSGQVLRINGHADFEMPNCILGSVSTDSDSIRCNGCSASGSWDIAGIATAGGIRINGQTPPVPIFTQFPIRNPYVSVTKSPLTGSLPSGPCTADPDIGTAHLPLSPGLYCGLSFSAGAQVVLNPGIYYIDGGDFQIGFTSSGGTSRLTSGASITGTGVTIVLTRVTATHAGAIHIEPGTTCNATPAVISLSAPGPAAGLLQPSATVSQGLLIFQDPAAVTNNTPATTITSGKTSSSCDAATVTLSGAIDTPKSDLTLKGNRVIAVRGCTEFIAQSFLFSGTPQLDDSGCNPPSTQGGDGSTGVTINQAIVQQIFLRS